MDLVTLASTALITPLLAAYRSTLILGAAILSFSGVGIGLLIGSALTGGWWQAFQLAIGTSLLFVGTVELGILGVLRRVLGEDQEGTQSGSNMQVTLHIGASDTFSSTHLTASQLATILSALSGPDEGPRTAHKPTTTAQKPGE